MNCATAKRALVTVGVGPMSGVLECALPTFRKFAERFGYDVILGNARWSFDRPAAWAKIPLILDALEKYDFVLWLDADTIILDDFARPR